MSNNESENPLDRVYDSGSTEELVSGYDQWAETYEVDMAAGGYRHPSICLGLFTRHVAPDSGAILDAGAGTGIIGDWLRILGYSHLIALDASDGMLRVARRKSVYDVLHKACLGDELPFNDDDFSAVICSGVFTLGHAGPEALDDLLRVVRPGGSIVLTVKDKLYLDGGFKEHLESLKGTDRIRVTEETPSYISIPGEEGQSTSRALVLEVR